MINIRGVELKTTIQEFTISEYNEILSIINNKDIGKLDGNLAIIVLAGLKDEDLLYELTFKELSEYMTMFNKDYEDVDMELKKEIIIGDKVYKSYEDEFQFSAKDVSTIQNIVNSKPTKWILECFALIFKDTEKKGKQHFDKKHIKAKSILFKDLSAELALPLIYEIIVNIINKMDVVKNSEKIEDILKEYTKFEK